jgi:hypothetical protein
MHPRSTQLALAMLAALLASSSARGDVFMLTSGGRVTGEWVNRGGSLQEPYRVRTASGLLLSLERGHVDEVVAQRPELLEYERLAPTVDDTVDAQWKLAEWCRERHLTEEREVHLRRIIALDQQHLPARRALGYAQVDGEWLTRDEWRRRQGYELYRGRWRLTQEISLIEERRKRDLAEKEWMQRIHTLRDMLTTANAASAQAQLLAIKDPRAVSTVADYLRREKLRPAKLIFVQVLANIADSPATRVLVATSLSDPDEEVRVACLDRIVELDPPGVVSVFVRALGDRNNFHVNRAGYALARLGDSSTLAPLIDALVTKHTFVYEAPNAGSPDTITSTFRNDQAARAAGRPTLPGASSGMSMGGGKKVITQRIQNQEVLTALLKLSGGTNYGYDQTAWRQWLESQQSAAAFRHQQ